MVTRLSIVILTCNQRALLADCLQSLGALHSDDSVEIIVVDNGSTDGTRDYLADAYPRVMLISNAENRGVAAARNQGLTAACGKVLMLLDNDTIASPEAIQALYDYAVSHPEVGVCGCRLVAPDGTVQQSFKSYPGLWVKVRNVLGMRRDEKPLPTNDDGTTSPVYVIGACQAFRREVWEKVGPLDEHIFYGPEDADFCIRVAKAGWQVRYLPQVTITHLFQRATTKRALSPLGRKHIKSLLYFYWKHKRLW